MSQNTDMQVTSRRLIKLALEAARHHRNVLGLMALLAGVASAILLGSVVNMLPEAIINIGTSSQEEIEKAIPEAVSLFWPLICVQIVVLLVQSALLVPWARYTSPFDLIPLGSNRQETIGRIFRVLMRQVTFICYWFFLLFICMTIANIVLPALPGAISEFLFFLVMIFMVTALFILGSFLHTIIIAEACFGKHTVPAIVQATKLMIAPLMGSLFFLSVGLLLASTFLSAIIAALLPDSLDLTIRLAISGATGFLTTAMHIGAINRLPIWFKAADDGSTDHE